MSGVALSGNNFVKNNDAVVPKIHVDTKSKLLQDLVRDKNQVRIVNDHQDTNLVKESLVIRTEIITSMEMFNDWKDDSTKNKLTTVLDTDKIAPKSSLKKGDTEIKYRFKADIEKSTFSAVKTSPQEYGKGKDFFYVNGINTTEKEANKTAAEISKLTGQNIKSLYNPTEGALKDLVEAASERFNDKKFDDITKKVAANFFETLSSGKSLKIVAHSQGAAITADALELCQKMLLIDLASKNINPINTFNTGFLPIAETQKIMSKVEVITLGGAASQDKFPDVRLVEVVNPKDPVPNLVGNDKLETCFSRKTVTDGKVSYVKNPNNVVFSSKLLPNNLQHVISTYKHIGGNLTLALCEGAKQKNIIDYHKIDEGKDAYLHQQNVRSLLYNFGRQDFQLKK